jgi:hypothetical protein
MLHDGIDNRALQPSNLAKAMTLISPIQEMSLYHLSPDANNPD